MWLAVLLLHALAHTRAAAADTVRRSVQSTELLGLQSGPSGVLSFRGIPYATIEAPFAPPTDLSLDVAKNLKLNVTSFGPACTPADPFSPLPLNHSMDCHVLNIWMPSSRGHSRAVIVFLHGGDFVVGSSTDVDPEKFVVEHDVVFVSVNYRLGPLGFVRLPLNANRFGDQSANLGLQDQQSALRWVRKYARDFGGDPTRITLWGHAAGALCVCSHLVAPQSRGLFRRAVIHGHSCETELPTADEALDSGWRLLNASGCSRRATVVVGGYMTTRTCLVKRPASLWHMQTLLPQPHGVAAAGLVFHSHTARWIPYIDGQVLPDQPATLIRQGKVHPGVDVMVGATPLPLWGKLALERAFPLWVPGCTRTKILEKLLSSTSSAVQEQDLALLLSRALSCSIARTAHYLAESSSDIKVFLYHLEGSPSVVSAGQRSALREEDPQAYLDVAGGRFLGDFAKEGQPWSFEKDDTDARLHSALISVGGDILAAGSAAGGPFASCEPFDARHSAASTNGTFSAVVEEPWQRWLSLSWAVNHRLPAAMWFLTSDWRHAAGTLVAIYIAIKVIRAFVHGARTASLPPPPGRRRGAQKPKKD